MATQEGVRSPATPPGLTAATVCEAFQLTARARAGEVAWRAPGEAVEISWREYAERARRAAAGLAALGVGHGDTLALMLTNRPEFHCVDCGAIHLGATPFSIYNTSAPEQVNHLLRDSGSRVVVTERAFLDRVRAALPGTAVEHVVAVDGDGADGTLTLAELEARGDEGFDLEAAARAVTPEDVLTLIYTSGTTGPPKGVQLTHANLMFEVCALQEAAPVTPGGRIVSFLPAAHIADRWSCHYSPMALGFTVVPCSDPGRVMEVVAEVRPTVFGAVPRVWEKLQAVLAPALPAGPPFPEEVGAGVRAKLGLDEVEWFVVGAAPTPVETLDFFAGLGIPICELWGLSETTAVATLNPREAIKRGTVGPAIPGVELRVEGDGEVLVRGPNVMKGYRNQPEQTARALDDDGWLHTGDVGEMDGDGYLRIVDRKKELIVNAAGKNMSPALIEADLKAASPLIGQACVIGDRRPYNVALVVLDPDASAAFVAEHDLDTTALGSLAAAETVIAAVASAVATANQRLSRVEQIKKFKLLDEEWPPGGDELTPTMKLKRKPIALKYRDEIEALYLD